MRLRVFAVALLLLASAACDGEEPVDPAPDPRPPDRTALAGVCRDTETALLSGLGMFPAEADDSFFSDTPPRVDADGFTGSFRCRPWLKVDDKPRIPPLEVDVFFDVFEAGSVPAVLPGHQITAKWCGNSAPGGRFEERDGLPVCRYADEVGDSGTTAKAVTIVHSTVVTVTVYAVEAQADRLTSVTDSVLDTVAPLVQAT